MFLSASVVPPIVLLGALLMYIPSLPLWTFVSPVTSVPMIAPHEVTGTRATEIVMPRPAFLEMTLQAPVQGRRALCRPFRQRYCPAPDGNPPELPRAAEPGALVPM
jgi:hypothetical protein